MNIKFHGAAKMVTGSNFLIETKNYKILIDCGLFQGNKAVERMNEDDFPYIPSEIDFLILTHAHIDHSGRIPKLVKEGFTGRIFCTNPTYDLAKIMLKDSAHIQESDAEWENKRRERAGKELVTPLYTKRDAENSLNYFEPYFLDQKIKVNENITIRFKDAGHILGSAIVELWIVEDERVTKLVFSGDLGVKGRPILNDPEFIQEADYLIVESTYGNSLHDSYKGSIEDLIEIIDTTALRGGTVIIPSFAVGRTQELIYKLNEYYEYKDVEEHMRIPIYIDSPMAVEATKAFQKNSSSFNNEARDLILSGDNPFEFKNLRYIESQEESKLLNKYEFPKVIISASGMATGGRILHHLKHNLWNYKNSLVFVGYQAEGTLGRNILDGARKVKLLGEDIGVALQVHNLEGFSAHADKEGILNWINGFTKKPKEIFIVHGEIEASTELAESIKERFNIKTTIPELDDKFKINGNKTILSEGGKPITKRLKRDIEKELDEINKQFNAFIDREDEILEDKILSKEYDVIKNNLIELQHALMDLNMIIGK